MESGNNRIAKNTLALYFRQILIMVVTLYTSRVVLRVLGVNDFGIYNVVGGVVTMFSFITGTMGSASQRFLAFDMAKGDAEQLRQTFSLIMLSYFVLVAMTVVLSESIAVWFLKNHMNIPADRMVAANWVLQLSILSFLFSILQAPYMSVIIAHERMDVYAYVSIVEVILKLAIVYMLQAFTYDKLIVYGILMALNTVCVFTFYAFYCLKHFPETRYRYFFDVLRLKELCSYALWNIIGSLAMVLRSQGINILLNIFFNPAVNAARGIAYQVNSAITSFYNNFYTAVKPQIVKSYAVEDKERMLSLICQSTKFAYFLVLILATPFFFLSADILRLWLGISPELTDLFVILVLVTALIETLSMPLVAGMQAANRIKEIQLTVSVLYLLNIPISYLFLKFGYPAETPMYVNIVLIVIAFVPRIYLAHKILGLSIVGYARRVLLRIAFTTIATLCVCHILYRSLYGVSIAKVLCTAILMCMIATMMAVIIGMTNKEIIKIIRVIRKRYEHH